MQAGGFAGLLRGRSLDPATLAPDDANRLADLVSPLERHLQAAATSDRSANEPSPSTDPALRDQHSYQLTLERSGCAPASCQFDDSAVPADLWPLLRFLQQHGTPD